MKVILDTTEKKKEQQCAIRQKYAMLMAQVVSPYTQIERETWFTQLSEANMYLADPTAVTPLITAMAAQRNVLLSDLVTWIKENEAAYRTAIGTLLGMQQKELDEL
jgi:hypothetical protein